MARKYSRDNRGRFAGGGGGATARGGRLRTAAGNKRKTQTKEIAAKPKNTIGKPKGLKPGAIKAKAVATAKPMARKARKSVGSIDSAKAGRIVSRIDANRPGLRKASASSKRTNNMLKTHERATNFILSASAKARKKGENISVNESVQRGVATASRSARRRATAKPTAKPARAAAKPKSGRDITKAEMRKVQNQKLRSINTKIKDAGPNAAGLRLQKLQVQDSMTRTRPKPTAKQAAKSAQQDQVVRGRIAAMRQQNARVGRAEAKFDGLRSSSRKLKVEQAFARRGQHQILRTINTVDSALAFYKDSAKALRGVKKGKGFRLPRTMR